MEQIQQKGLRDGNAIFAQIPGWTAAKPHKGSSEAPVGPAGRWLWGSPARLDPRRKFAKECAVQPEKDPM